VEWKNKMQEKVDDYFNTGEIPESQVFTWNKSAQWYIRLLVEKSVPFQVFQKGAGVKEVVVQSQRCAMCKGKGYIPSKEE
jgi:hypothetical protein